MLNINESYYFSKIYFEDHSCLPHIVNDLRVWRNEVKEGRNPNQFTRVSMRMNIESRDLKFYDNKKFTLQIPISHIDNLKPIIEYWIIVLDKIFDAYIKDNYYKLIQTI